MIILKTITINLNKKREFCHAKVKNVYAIGGLALVHHHVSDDDLENLFGSLVGDELKMDFLAQPFWTQNNMFFRCHNAKIV